MLSYMHNFKKSFSVVFRRPPEFVRFENESDLKNRPEVSGMAGNDCGMVFIDTLASFCGKISLVEGF